MSYLDEVLEKHPSLGRVVDALGADPEEGLSLREIATRLIVACAAGWLIGQVYRRTYTGRKLSPTLPDTHLLLCMGGALIWLVVGDNLVRAFGLAGTIGLIRYRTVVRDPKDTTILLFSMVMGMACGLGYLRVVIVGTIFVLCILVFLHWSHVRQTAARLRESSDLLDLLEGDDEAADRKRPRDDSSQED